MIANSVGLKESYYTPLTSIVGTRLRTRHVAVGGLAAVALAAERLADCRVLHWHLYDNSFLTPAHPLVRLWGSLVGLGPAAGGFARALRTRTSWEDGWAFAQAPGLTESTYVMVRQQLAAQRPDLLLGGGDAAMLHLLGRLARDLDLPAVLVALAAGNDPRAAVLVLLPGDGGHGRDVPDLLRFLDARALLDPTTDALSPASWMNWQDANASAAALARALLLQGSTFAPPDLTRLLYDEHRTALIQGAPGWPWLMQYIDLARAGLYHAPDALLAPVPPQPITGPILVIGCGSLGSHTARALLAAGAVHELAFVDGGFVNGADLLGQFYTSAQVGQNKAEALTRQMMALAPTGARINPEWTASAYTDQWSGLSRISGDWCFTQVARAARPGAWFTAMLDTLRPAAAIVTVDGAGDAALAQVLRARGIPHVVGRCDATATYFEAVLVDGRHGPCFECMHDEIFAPPPAGTRATVIEIGRAADLIARLAWQLSLPRGARAAWFARLLADRRTALIGSNGARRRALPALGTPDATAYGIRVPGQVMARNPAPAPAAGLDCVHSVQAS